MPMSGSVMNDNWIDRPDPTKKLLRVSEVAELVGISRSM